MSTTDARTVTHDDFQDDASDDHITAFFNPIEEYREKALRKIRAKSGHSPDVWTKLDAAAGIASTDEDGEKIEAASPMPHRMGIDYEMNGLDEQFIRSTVMDVLAGSGFGIPSDLSSYVYARPLQAGRMEAETAMDVQGTTTQDRERNALDGVAQPINYVTYKLGGREMEVRRAYGEDPEARPAREARRALNRREHGVLYNGWGGTFEMEGLSFTIGGLDNPSSDAVLTAANSAGWSDPSNVLSDHDALHDTIEQQTDVVDEDDVPLVSEIGALVMVPYTLWGNVMRQDYESSATDEPLIDRLNRKYPYLTWVPAPRLNEDHVIMLLNDPRYFGVVNAQGVTNTAWDVDGGASRKHRLVSSRIPWVRAQPGGVNGIVQLTGVSS
jgi:hypothetical protein